LEPGTDGAWRVASNRNEDLEGPVQRFREETVSLVASFITWNAEIGPRICLDITGEQHGEQRIPLPGDHAEESVQNQQAVQIRLCDCFIARLDGRDRGVGSTNRVAGGRCDGSYPAAGRRRGRPSIAPGSTRPAGHTLWRCSGIKSAGGNTGGDAIQAFERG
jgi:hypothetical protein